ncbi:phosphotransferase [Streptomyces sp. NPDC032198]|uniref:phosphotransferase n=1 Tax=Streptomyces sp. NPDC032198 TaxID=3155127 RepID=UPI003406DC11
MGMTDRLLGSGRTADVFALDDTWVLRRYRDGTDATEEAAVMAYLSEHGYPVPPVRPAAPGSPHTDLVMGRLTGPTMAEAAMRGVLTPEEAAVILARLLQTLHALPARSSTSPADRVLHLDLHPENVILTPEGPVVIDWSTTEEGPPGLDWAMSALILAEVAVSGRPEAAGSRVALATLLTDAAVDVRATAKHHLAEARARRAANPTLGEDEVRCLEAAGELVLELHQ